MHVQVRVRQDGEDVRYQVLARGDGADEARDAAVLRDYFNLDTGLAALSDDWAARDGRYAAIRDYIAGARAAMPGLYPRLGRESSSVPSAA